MKTPWKMLLAAASAACCAFPVHAIPISFDISGTVGSRQFIDFATGERTIDNSLFGRVFTASFFVDTDALRVTQRIDDDPYAEFLLIRDAGPALAVQASLSIGGVLVDAAPYEFDESVVQFSDSRGPVETCDELGCYSSVPRDSWLVGVRSGTTSPQVQAPLRSMFGFYLAEPFDFDDPTAGGTWLNFPQSTSVDQLATLPLGDFTSRGTLKYGENTRTTRTDLDFNVTSFVRTVHSVPEPGSLALLAAGLLGVFASRRRRAASRDAAYFT